MYILFAILIFGFLIFIHELGHYFGLSEDQLAAMGYE